MSVQSISMATAHRFGAFVRCRFKGIQCVSTIMVNINEVNPDCSFPVNKKMDLVVKDVQEITS